MMNRGQIIVDDVSYSYDGLTDVVDHVSLTIQTGEYVVILGHNGSGKSTLIRQMNGLLIPDSGHVSVAGLDTSDEDNLPSIHKSVGMVFQNPDDQMVTSVVRDDVAFGPENNGVPQEEIIQRIDDSLKRVAMTEYAQASPANLSGGQKQRVAIAGILAMEPNAILFDEPSAMLDPRGRRGMRRIMRELNNQGYTIVHVTHFMGDALEADNVYVMEQGKIAFGGNPQEVFSHGNELRNMGLETPFSMQLTHELRKLGIDIHDTMDEEVLEGELCRLSSNM